MIKYPTNSNENKSTNICQANSHKLEGSQYISNENGGDSQWRENEGMNGDMNIMDTVEDSPCIMNDESHVESSQFLDSPCPFFVTTNDVVDVHTLSCDKDSEVLIDKDKVILVEKDREIMDLRSYTDIREREREKKGEAMDPIECQEHRRHLKDEIPELLVTSEGTEREKSQVETEISLSQEECTAQDKLSVQPPKVVEQGVQDIFTEECRLDRSRKVDESDCMDEPSWSALDQAIFIKVNTQPLSLISIIIKKRFYRLLLSAKLKQNKESFSCTLIIGHVWYDFYGGNLL